ncbi:uncharacterized protein LOC131145784 [Malania oleifera]|uniref:uncharacterized protein LOC131145784 n=1 Tax=Malania oleifera TaxID=397392 RepID=UPI0025ADF2F6|nr:uncharacterized protein LOC131145784 [Malania oleifera]
MQSLSLRAFSDFYTGMGRSWPGRRGSFGFADLETGTRRQWPCGIVACSSVRNGGGGGGDIHSSSSFLSRSQTYALLKQQMEVAAKSEDYKEAARLRDSLKSVEEEEPVLRLRGLMKEAVADERFERHSCIFAQKFGLELAALEGVPFILEGLDEMGVSGVPGEGQAIGVSFSERRREEGTWARWQWRRRPRGRAVASGQGKRVKRLMPLMGEAGWRNILGTAVAMVDLRAKDLGGMSQQHL